MPKQDQNLLPQQKRMICGELQKLPRKANSKDKVQLTIRISKKSREFIRKYAKKQKLSQGDAFDQIIEFLDQMP